MVKGMAAADDNTDSCGALFPTEPPTVDVTVEPTVDVTVTIDPALILVVLTIVEVTVLVGTEVPGDVCAGPQIVSCDSSNDQKLR